MAELPQREITLIIVIGTTLVLFFVGSIAVFIALYQRRMLLEQERQKKLQEDFQQQMIQAQLQSQENERKRIAADLHDSMGSLLSGAKLNALFLERTVSMDDEVKATCTDLVDSLEQAIRTVRRIAWELTPDSWHTMGLCESVRLLCDRINGKGVKVEFSCNIPDVILNDEQALSVYRIMQELISNCLKHSQAQVMRIEITSSRQELVLIVEDDGVGFSSYRVRSGLGWWNIKQRATHLKAKIEIGVPSIGKGSLVRIHVPFL